MTNPPPSPPSEPHQRDAMLARVEQTLGLEPAFSALPNERRTDLHHPFAVYDAEMVEVCVCSHREVSNLICELLNGAAGEVGT